MQELEQIASVGLPPGGPAEGYNRAATGVAVARLARLPPAIFIGDASSFRRAAGRWAPSIVQAQRLRVDQAGTRLSSSPPDSHLLAIRKGGKFLSQIPSVTVLAKDFAYLDNVEFVIT